MAAERAETRALLRAALGGLNPAERDVVTQLLARPGRGRDRPGARRLTQSCARAAVAGTRPARGVRRRAHGGALGPRGMPGPQRAARRLGRPADRAAAQASRPAHRTVRGLLGAATAGAEPRDVARPVPWRAARRGRGAQGRPRGGGRPGRAPCHGTAHGHRQGPARRGVPGGAEQELRFVQYKRFSKAIAHEPRRTAAIAACPDLRRRRRRCCHRGRGRAGDVGRAAAWPGPRRRAAARPGVRGPVAGRGTGTVARRHGAGCRVAGRPWRRLERARGAAGDGRRSGRAAVPVGWIVRDGRPVGDGFGVCVHVVRSRESERRPRPAAPRRRRRPRRRPPVRRQPAPSASRRGPSW